jgi:predicted NBD/HSP70 family sugar kinase
MRSRHRLYEVFSDDPHSGGVAVKNKYLKKSIINQLDRSGDLTIAELARELNISTPKVTSLVNELIQDGLLRDYGKIDSTGGRRANIYGLMNNACYFIGVDVRRYYVNIGLLDFKKHLVALREKLPFQLENTAQSLSALITCIKEFIREQKIAKDKILGMGISLSGRVNHNTGYSYSFFHFQEAPLTDIIQQETGIRTFLENDSNAMAYGEFCNGVVTNEKSIVFINLDYGTGAGLLIDGEIYYGKSGFSGEFGHIPFYNNDIMCNCGKKGCLETEVSGQALLRLAREKLAAGTSSLLLKKVKRPDDLKLEDLVAAAQEEDMLLIELLADMGEKLGKSLAVLINLFNPELLVLGGTLAETGDFLRLPARSALNKYALSLVNNDTQLKLSKLGERAGVVGVSLIARNKVLSL